MAPVVLFSRSGGGDGGGGGALHSLVGKSNSGRAASVVTVEEAEDDAEDDVEASFQRPAFAVDGEPQDEDAPPCDGLEYLRRVRKEASSLPQIVRKTAVHYDVMKGGDELKQKNAGRGAGSADDDEPRTCSTSWQISAADLPATPRQLLPRREWEELLLADFTLLRAKLRAAVVDDNPTGRSASPALPSLADLSSWEALCMGSTRGCDGTPPTLRLLLRLDQAKCMAAAAAVHARADKEGALSEMAARWAFALLARLERALPSEHAATLRALLRTCASLRAALGRDQCGSLNDPVLDDASMEHLARLNTIICLTGRFFGQASQEELSGAPF